MIKSLYNNRSGIAENPDKDHHRWLTNDHHMDAE
jgi:hypothetical protein